MKALTACTRAYFDCNATTPVLPVAAKAALDAMQVFYGNPSSAHLVGLQAKHLLESTRKLAGRVLGAGSEQIIFTSGASEAIHTAIFSALQTLNCAPASRQLKLLYGAAEHKVVPEALHHWVKTLNLPFKVEKLPIDSRGQIQLDCLRKELPETALLCTMAVNNETGVIQDLAAIESLLHETNSQALWLVDCVQALGKIDLKLSSSRIDYASFSGHKLYAPKGIGVLYARKGAPLVPLIVGGGQENGFRSGTENLPGVAALGAVLEELINRNGKSCFSSHTELLKFRDRLIFELERAFPKIEFNTPLESSVPTTINFSIPGLTSAELLDLFDSAGLRLSAGSACSSASPKPSYVLDAMGLPQWRALSALRLSFGPATSEMEIERGCQIIRECAIALQNTCLLDTPGNFEAPEKLRDGLIQFRASSTNSWLIVDSQSKKCVMIDPCDTLSDRIAHYIHCQNLEVLGILDTHSHADHESVRPILQKVLASHLSPSTNQFDDLGWPKGSNLHLIHVTLDNNDTVPALLFRSSQQGELVLAQIKTPGHTHDSHTFLFGFSKQGYLKAGEIRFAFPGDAILSGGLGRTNFSVSNPEALFTSLRVLQTVLSPTTLLCPSHDYNQSFATSLQTEVASNALLALALQPLSPLTLNQFLKRKSEIDAELLHIEENFQGIVCGVTLTSQADSLGQYTIEADQIKEYLKSDSTLVVDVREPQEHSTFKDWISLGLRHSPRNVPLSRLVNFMSELTISKGPAQDVILICKTGTRSLQATKSLRRLGISRAWSLAGGIAKAMSAGALA